MIWQKDTIVDIQSFSKYNIDVEVTKLESNEVWRITGFYGEPDATKQTKTWALLKHLAQLSNRPWVFLSDFNEVASNNDKKGGCLVPAWRMRYMRDTLSHCGLHEIDFEGYKFTWANNREEERYTQLRLGKDIAKSD